MSAPNSLRRSLGQGENNGETLFFATCRLSSFSSTVRPCRTTRHATQFSHPPLGQGRESRNEVHSLFGSLVPNLFSISRGENRLQTHFAARPPLIARRTLKPPRRHAAQFSCAAHRSDRGRARAIPVVFCSTPSACRLSLSVPPS